VLGSGSLSRIAGKLSDAAGRAEDTVDTAGAATAKASPVSRWLLPLLLILVLIAIIWYFMSHHSPGPTTPVMEDTVTVIIDTPAAMASEPEQVKVKLPGGREPNAFRDGMEDQLVTFLNDPDSRTGKEVWFDFDNLNFKTGREKDRRISVNARSK
jgi:hypothetical protein